VALAAAAEVSGQIFGCTGDNIAVLSQPRPVAVATRESGWSVDDILSEALPQLSEKFHTVALSPPPGQIGVVADPRAEVSRGPG
jgi:hypothetical protein